MPDREVAWQILALNTEKAHNLKERSLEVIRIYRGLVEEDATRPESSFSFYLEEAAFATLGICYERAPRFGGGVFHPILRRLETFTDEPVRAALKVHEKRAGMVLNLEEMVATVVRKLKERGLVSPIFALSWWPASTRFDGFSMNHPRSKICYGRCGNERRDSTSKDSTQGSCGRRRPA